MTAPGGNGTHAFAPAFDGARITPDQAEALAANFLPSWELDEPAPVVATASNGVELRATMKSNGVHAETHAPPPRTHVSEPVESVVIDGGLVAPPAPPAPAAVAAPYVAPAAPYVPAPQAAPQLAPPARSAIRTVPPARMQPAVARAPSIDDEIIKPKSKTGLFVGVGVAVAAVAAIAIGFAVSGGDEHKSPEAAGSAITVVKTDETSKVPPPPPPATTQAAPTQAAVTSTPVATQAPAAATIPTMPVTALPVAASQPAKPKPAQPAYTAPPPAARPTPPRAGGGSSIVKDVPF